MTSTMAFPSTDHAFALGILKDIFALPPNQPKPTDGMYLCPQPLCNFFKFALVMELEGPLWPLRWGDEDPGVKVSVGL